MECDLREDAPPPAPVTTGAPLALLLLVMLLAGDVISPKDSITEEGGEDLEGGAI